MVVVCAGSSGGSGDGAGGAARIGSANGDNGTAPGGGGSGGYYTMGTAKTGGTGGAGQVAITYAQTYTWTNSAGSAWLMAAYWTPASGPPTNIDTAVFDSTTTNTSISINMNTAGGSYSVCEIQLTGGTNRTISDSSTTVAGTLTLNGISSVALQNSSAYTLTLTNGSSAGTMNVAFGNSGQAVDITSRAASLLAR